MTSAETADPEAASIVLVQNGDEAALGDLYRSLGGTLLAVILRIVRDRSIAEEVLQECFVEIWTRSDRFDPARGSGRGWIVGLCRSRAIDRVRSVEAARRRELDDAQKASATPQPSVETIVEATLDSEAASKALSALPPEQAEPIYLAYYQGLTHQQISTQLNRPLGTVKTQIRDGMIRLRRAMKEAQ